MSIKLMEKVWGSALNRDEKAVMLCLADFGNDRGESIYPAINYIAWKTGYSRTAVKAVLRKMRAAKILTVGFAGTAKQSKYGTNNYRINVARLPGRPPYKAPSLEEEEIEEEELPDEIPGLPEELPQNPGLDSEVPEIPEIALPRGGSNLDPPYMGGVEIRPGGGLNSPGGGSKLDPNTLVNPLVYPLVLNNAAENSGNGNGNGHRTDAVIKGDLLDGVLAFSGKDYSVEHYPEDVREVIRRFCQLWGLIPPGEKAPEFGLWITDAHRLMEAAGDMTIRALEDLKANPYDWLSKVGVSHPGTLKKAVTSRAGELRSNGKNLVGENTYTGGWESQAEMDATRARIKAAMAAKHNPAIV